MKVRQTPLPGVFLIEPDIYPDARGRFSEAWRESRYVEYGIHGPFTQDNVSVSRKHVLRGLHIQAPLAQGKLVFSVTGAISMVPSMSARARRASGNGSARR